MIDISDRFGKIRDQGKRRTCLAFAATAANEHLHGLHDSLCVEWLYYHALKILGKKPNSGTRVTDVSAVLKKNGQPFEDYWRYSRILDLRNWFLPEDSPCTLFFSSGQYARYNFAETVTLLKLGQPVVFTRQANAEFNRAAIVEGIATVENNSLSVKLGNHAVPAVGVGVSNQRNYLKVRNSWGLGWGNDGYAWLSEEFLLENAVEIFWLNKVE